ncbi:MAG TPA: cbb3-type cytochrome oxidase assembly protein CcoS [Chryseolinea sp.]|nr:cbb3-type cytochrome oxidase assembly protein CcoS [Chryseolinea sp.]
MNIIIVLIAISLNIAVAFLIAFLYSVKSGQYDDTYSPSIRMLFDDKIKTKSVKEKEHGNSPKSKGTIEKV